MGKSAQAHATLFIVGVFYAVNYIVAKPIMPHYIGPSGFIFYRVFGAAVLFWLASPFFPREKIHRGDWLRLTLCAAFGVAVNQLFFFNGLNLTSPINSSVIMTSNPVLVLLASAIILKERITATKVTGVVLGIVGALMLIALPALSGGSMRWGGDAAQSGLGDVMILINSLFYSMYLIAVQPLMGRYSTLTIIKWVFTIGGVMVLPFTLEQALAVDWVAMPTGIFWGAVYVVVGVSFLAYLLNLYAMKTLSPTVVSAYVYLQPVLAGTLSLAFGMEKLHWLQVVAALLIFTGVYLVSIRKAGL